MRTLITALVIALATPALADTPTKGSPPAKAPADKSPAKDTAKAAHELAENDLVGKWTGSVETTMDQPADHATGKQASKSKSKADATFEIKRVNGALVSSAGPSATPMKLVREKSALVDKSQPDTQIVTYSMQGDTLKVETTIKGHFGGTSVGTFKRVP